MDGIILVGGFGTRLLPLTKMVPKPLIPLANIPFLMRAITWLRDEGVTRVILSLHYNADLFIEQFTAMSLGVEIAFAVEETPLGTGGAIKNCESHLRADRCYVVNGDIFTDLQLHRLHDTHRQAGALATIALYEVDDPSRFGVIETDVDGRINSFTEKPPRELARSRDINAGIYLFERSMFDYFPATPCSVERDIFPMLLQRGLHLHGYRDNPYWTDLGTPADYLQAHRDILTGTVRIPIPGREEAPGIWVGVGAEIAQSAQLVPPVLLGPGVSIAANATLGPMVALGADVRIGASTVLRDSVVWDGAVIHPNSSLQSSIIGRYAEIRGSYDQTLCEDYGSLGLSDIEQRAA